MEEKKNIMDYDTVSLDDENSAVVIIDQTKLPGTTEIIALKTAQEIWDAIYLLQVRGAPAIGVAAAYGIYVLAKGIDTDNYDAFYAEFKKTERIPGFFPPDSSQPFLGVKPHGAGCIKQCGQVRCRDQTASERGVC